VLAGEAMEGRGARRWWDSVRRSRKRCSPVGELWGEGGRGAISGSARSGGVGLGCAGSGVAGSIGWREVGWVAWGRMGGMGEAGTRRVGRLSARDSIGRLDRWVQVMDLWSITLCDE
jgi:hypothetical protein